MWFICEFLQGVTSLQNFFQYIYWKYMYKWTWVVQSCVVWVSCSCSQVFYNPLYFFDISCNVSSFIYNFIDFGPFLPLDCPVKGWPILFIFSKSPPLFIFFSLAIVFLLSMSFISTLVFIHLEVFKCSSPIMTN